ncbi:MAG: 7-cyano-7-deazaguanine synthase QueC [Elusimicrobiota bacterium]
MKKAVVLLSGGMDSAVCLSKAKQDGYEIYALTVDYGQKSRHEIEAAKRIAEKEKVSSHLIMKVDLREIGGSALTNDDIEVPEEGSEGVPVTYVPARNLIFLSLAVSWAEVLGAEAVFIGANVRDYSGYPDCREEFLKSFEKTAALGTKGKTRISIKAPLLNRTKAEIIEQGKRLNIDFNITSSCYNPGLNGEPCGKCESCQIRKRGFEELGIKAHK